MYYSLLFLLTIVFMTTSSVLGQVSKNSHQQTTYSNLSQYEPIVQIQEIPADKTVGAHWWDGRSLSFTENPIRLKKGQNLIIPFENPSDKLGKAGNTSSWSCMYRVKYIVYGDSLSNYNQNPFDFTQDDHTPYTLRFQATSPGPRTINFVVTCSSKGGYDSDTNSWFIDGTSQITSYDLQIIVEDN